MGTLAPGDERRHGAHRGAQDVSRPAGQVYLYQRAGTAWALAATLTGIYPNQNEQFGGAVALDGVTAIVSAAHSYDPAVGVIFGYEPGAAYIFRKSGAGWTQEAHVVAPAGEAHFGNNVDISGDRAIIGGSGSTSTSGAPGSGRNARRS
jgi:hypothetical protein